MLDVRYILVLVFAGAVLSINLIEYPQSIQPYCNMGEVIKNECTKCICSQNIYRCSSLECNNNFTVSEELKESTQDPQIINTICHAKMTYILNSTICICNKDGFWPDTECSNIFKSMPANNVTKPYCEPNSYVTIDCNVCRCGPLGEIQKDHCTDNVCTNKIESKRRTSSKSAKIYGSCEENYWYSLAPCQLCFCVRKNKLVCNTGNNNSKKIELGSYNLNVCGKELIREAMDLIAGKQKVLRYGKTINIDIKGKSETDPKQYVKVDHSHEIPIQSNNEDENINTNNNNIANKEDKNKYYSESDADSQEIVTVKTIGRDRLRTQLPYDDDEQDSGRNNFESDRKDDFQQEDSEDKEVGVEKEQQSSRSSETQVEKDTDTERETQLESIKSLGQSLSANLPSVLSKVLNIALRKSMVSLSNNSKCEPGTTTTVQCNTCFCMKNHKLLCTKNDCVE